MADGARSDHPGVQAQLDRLALLSPGGDRLGLDRITRLLERLGRPQDRLPPTFHVAGTNGKGSTCAFLRTALEASGHRTHVFTSPHLVRFNERIRLAGALIGNDQLAALLAEVLDASSEIGPSFFEVTTAAAFLAFSRTPADALVLEVGMGGRLDATNVIEQPLVTGIAALGHDHQQWLGSRLADIAGEKAGIAKAGVPLVTMRCSADATNRIAEAARTVGTPLYRQGAEWQVRGEDSHLTFCDNSGSLTLPLPALAGAHQVANAGLAIAMLRQQTALPVSADALAAAMTNTRWPARLQRLRPGPLIGSREVWLDGGHNPQAAQALAAGMAEIAGDRTLRLIAGVLETKDAAGLMAPFSSLAADVQTVPFDHPLAIEPGALADIARAAGLEATPQSSVAAALAALPADEPVLIAGSLYLAGEVLRFNGERPD